MYLGIMEIGDGRKRKVKADRIEQNSHGFVVWLSDAFSRGGGDLLYWSAHVACLLGQAERRHA